MKETKNDKNDVRKRQENDKKMVFSNIKKLEIDNDIKNIEQTIAEERFEEF